MWAKRKRKGPRTRRQALIVKLDRVFSQYIRLYDAADDGLCTCCTCGAVHSWTKMDAGHFYGRQCMNLRWDVYNVHPQCRKCNRFNEGRKDKYREYLVNEYGVMLMNRLDAAAMRRKKWTLVELEALIWYYESKVSALLDMNGRIVSERKRT